MSLSTNLLLMKPFSEEEFKDIISSCDKNKILGPNKLNNNFSKECWDPIQKGLLIFMSKFHTAGKLTKAITTSFLSLIPKKVHSQELGDFRPICLIGSL